MTEEKDELEQKGVPMKCPRCSAPRGGKHGLQWHRLTVWCMNSGCGWAMNLTGTQSGPVVERRDY